MRNIIPRWIYGIDGETPVPTVECCSKKELLEFKKENRILPASGWFYSMTVMVLWNNKFNSSELFNAEFPLFLIDYDKVPERITILGNENKTLLKNISSDFVYFLFDDMNAAMKYKLSK